ncbi:Fungalysin metallopeptidase-domain-containing protein, partial [Armillaria novae-zelandiae]
MSSPTNLHTLRRPSNPPPIPSTNPTTLPSDQPAGPTSRLHAPTPSTLSTKSTGKASVNHLLYSSIQQLNGVHNMGEVWANMLHNVYDALIRVHGFSSTAMDDPSCMEGNVVWLHLFIDTLSLQPCNHTFLDARDAWIQADQNPYDGDNACTLWNAFASGGLGINAVNYVDDKWSKSVLNGIAGPCFYYWLMHRLSLPQFLGIWCIMYNFRKIKQTQVGLICLRVENLVEMEQSRIVFHSTNESLEAEPG